MVDGAGRCWNLAVAVGSVFVAHLVAVVVEACRAAATALVRREAGTVGLDDAQVAAEETVRRTRRAMDCLVAILPVCACVCVRGKTDRPCAMAVRRIKGPLYERRDDRPTTYFRVKEMLPTGRTTGGRCGSGSDMRITAAPVALEMQGGSPPLPHSRHSGLPEPLSHQAPATLATYSPPPVRPSAVGTRSRQSTSVTRPLSRSGPSLTEHKPASAARFNSNVQTLFISYMVIYRQLSFFRCSPLLLLDIKVESSTSTRSLPEIPAHPTSTVPALSVISKYEKYVQTKH